jgi:ABC-type Fe3+-citrate transport system substrate-binding protein
MHATMLYRMLTLCLLLLALAACSALGDSSAHQDSAVEQREGVMLVSNVACNA